MIKDPYNVIKSPVVTEKASAQAEVGNKVVFWVDTSANKIDIKKSIEKIFKVTVVGVNTQRVIGKVKRQGRFEGRRSLRKKAYITLKDGDTIQLVEGI